MAGVKEAVPDLMLSSSLDSPASAQIKAAFDKNSRQDEATGERYMTPEDFIDAVAPEGEDYVSAAAISYPTWNSLSLT
jgi:solute carrier family 25 aspartate/glutamate transporter 12/13